MRHRHGMSDFTMIQLPGVVLFVLLVSVEWCAAQEVDTAKARFLEGIELVEQEKYPEALAAFEASYAIHPKASVLFNIGMCQKALFQWSEAIETFRTYLESTEELDPQRRSDAEEAIEELIVLVRTVDDEDASREVREQSAVLFKAGWGLFGAGAVVALGGMVPGIMALGINNDLESDCRDGGCPPDSHDKLDQRDNLATASTVLIVTGAAAAVTGVVLLSLSHAKKKEKELPVSLTPAVAPQFAGATIRWRF